MGIRAEWIIACDGCGREQKTQRYLTKQTLRSGFMDEWGPGIPSGWMQDCRENEVPRFFHSQECYRNTLRKEEGEDAVREFDSSSWVA
jgi:hypothetical protein